MVACSLLTLLMAPPPPGPDPAELIARVTERMQALEGFSLVLRQRSFSPGRSMRTSEMRIDAAEGGKVRIETDKSAQVTVTNGKTWWRYSRAKNSYVEESDPQGGVAGGAAEAVRRVKTRVESLKKNAGEMRFVKWDRADVAGQKARCAVLEFRSPDKGGAWTAKVWIDPERLLIARIDMERVPGILETGEAGPGVRDLESAGELRRTVQEVVFDWRSLEAPAEAGLFEFVPPAGAQRVVAPVPEAQ